MSEQTNPEVDEERTEAEADAAQTAAGNGEDPGQQHDAGSAQEVAAGEGYEPENFQWSGQRPERGCP